VSGTVAIVVFFTGLLFIILIHEAGHYLVARAYGFKVEEYFVGFGPKIWSFRRNDIEYGVKEVGNAIGQSIHQITRVFGPSGIGRVFTLLFTDAQRGTQDPTSVVGIGQAVGQTGSSGDWGAVLYFLAFVTVFIGLINLLPLPPFDGGHLAVLLIEKVRGKALDMRKLIPVSAIVMSFFVVFVLATILLDLTKPIDFTP
jgi:membrane-associated protease RseP (regulator of RpoE activity)